MYPFLYNTRHITGLTMDIQINFNSISFKYCTFTILHKLLSNRLNILELCSELRIQIPFFCYHKNLSIAGNCRMCLVEYNNNLKPVVSCATVLARQSNVITNSLFIKRCREHILELLLINHPLDCPICDQAGECDLQDLTLVYASDRGRFLEKKRSVLDQSFHPLIKTIMTRCIHRTRCVRYMDEIINFPSLGTMGRGEDTLISTYDSSYLKTNMIGNIVDLCPVHAFNYYGALTSRPYAFKERPWLLTTIETYDLIESNCSPIRIDFKGNLIYRILPRSQSVWYHDYIHDDVRFGFYEFDVQRLVKIQTKLLYSKDMQLPNGIMKSYNNATILTKSILYKKDSLNILHEISLPMYITYLHTLINTLMLYNYFISFSIPKIININLLIFFNYVLNIFNKSNIGIKINTMYNNANLFINRTIGFQLIDFIQLKLYLIYLIIGVHLNYENPLLYLKLTTILTSLVNNYSNISKFYKVNIKFFLFCTEYELYDYSYKNSLIIHLNYSVKTLVQWWKSKHWITILSRNMICIQLYNIFDFSKLINLYNETINLLGYCLILTIFISLYVVYYTFNEFYGLNTIFNKTLFNFDTLFKLYQIIIISCYINLFNTSINLMKYNKIHYYYLTHIMFGTSLTQRYYFKFNIFNRTISNELIQYTYLPLLYIPLMTIFETTIDIIDSYLYYKKNINSLVPIVGLSSFELITNIFFFIFNFIFYQIQSLGVYDHLYQLLAINNYLSINIFYNSFLDNLKTIIKNITYTYLSYLNVKILFNYNNISIFKNTYYSTLFLKYL